MLPAPRSGSVHRLMRKLTRITIRLEEPLRKALEERATRDDETVPALIREAIRAFLGPSRKPQRSDE